MKDEKSLSLQGQLSLSFFIIVKYLAIQLSNISRSKLFYRYDPILGLLASNWEINNIEHHQHTRLRLSSGHDSDTNCKDLGIIQKIILLGRVAQILIYSRLPLCLADVGLFVRPKSQHNVLPLGCYCVYLCVFLEVH